MELALNPTPTDSLIYVQGAMLPLPLPLPPTIFHVQGAMLTLTLPLALPLPLTHLQGAVLLDVLEYLQSQEVPAE